MANVKVEKNRYTVDTLYQWDLNQVLEIYGLSLPTTPEIHFTNDIMVRAIRRFATMDAAGVIRVEVPNAMLQTSAKIKALVCIREGEVFKTYHEILIPVKARQCPADYTITDEDDIYSFLALENLVYDSVAKMEASNAAAAESARQAVNIASNAQEVANAAAETANSIAETAETAKTTTEELTLEVERVKITAETAKTTAENARVVNLLDNSDFTNPVNQRGASSYTGSKYGIDRWISRSGYCTVTVEEDYVNIKSTDGTTAAYVLQFIETGKIKSGKKYTAACQLKDGSIHTVTAEAIVSMDEVVKYIYVDGAQLGTIRFRYDSSEELYAVLFSTLSTSGMDIVNVVLYEGEYTAETLPEYQSKSYGAELAECQRYYQNWKRYETTGYLTGGGCSYCMPIYLDVPMRICPSVIGTPIWGARVATGGYSKYTSSNDMHFTEIIVFTEDSKDVSWLYICDELKSASSDVNNSVLAYRIENLEFSADL